MESLAFAMIRYMSFLAESATWFECSRLWKGMLNKGKQSFQRPYLASGDFGLESRLPLAASMASADEEDEAVVMDKWLCVHTILPCQLIKEIWENMENEIEYC